jgi:1-acyl-sn-glycerol-3-phosphate acyltransferase
VVRSIAAYGFLAAYTLILGPPALILARLTNRPTWLLAIGLTGIRSQLALAGVRSRLVGREHVLRDRAAVYCVNHSSYLDVVAFVTLYPLCPGLTILYKHELRRIPIVGGVFAAAGFVPIDRHHHDDAVHALDAGTEALKAGRSLLAAPEGTRSRDGTLQPFKKGVFVMAIKARAPVVPVAILGTGRALPKGTATITPGEIVVRVGAAVETEPFGYEGRERLAAEVRSAIATLIDM